MKQVDHKKLTKEEWVTTDETLLKELTKGSKNIKLLKSFAKYCLSHKEERFWQALRNWAKVGYILTADKQDDVRWIGLKDTFYKK